MEWYHAVILGIVEGITEYLPISSTGHLILTSTLLNLDEPEQTKRAIDAFNIVIQGGAILAVLGLYRSRVMDMVRGLLGKDPVGRKLAFNLFIAFLPAAVLGLLLADTIEAWLFFPGPVIAALAIGGVVMVLIKKWQRSYFHDPGPEEKVDTRTYVDIEHLTWKRSLLIGFMQCLAMWPGTSRSMVTIVGSMLAGMRPKQAAEFSFLLALPTLGGACVYSGFKAWSRDGADALEALGGPAYLVLGVATATIAAAISVKWLVSYLSRHSLAVFGWYRIALSVVFGILVWRGFVSFGPSETPGGETEVAHIDDASP